MTILITGVAGFIGMSVATDLLKSGFKVVGIDNLSDYYDVELKMARLNLLNKIEGFSFHNIDISNYQLLLNLAISCNFEYIIHLAAQAGVRYSLTHPLEYGPSNLTGFLNILEIAKIIKIKHLVYASSSSVYGSNRKIPFSEEDKSDSPLSLYGATKKSNELMAHSYSHLYKLPITGLRFFTVYGPWGRPDMAPSLFSRAIFENKPIKIFNQGLMKRDFTYIDDVVECIHRVLDKPINFVSNESDSTGAEKVSHQVLNVGNSNPIELMRFIRCLENSIGKEAIKVYEPIQAGDVVSTYADVTNLSKLINFSPRTKIEDGIPHFINWIKTYYKY